MLAASMRTFTDVRMLDIRIVLETEEFVQMIRVFVLIEDENKFPKQTIVEFLNRSRCKRQLVFGREERVTISICI